MRERKLRSDSDTNRQIIASTRRVKKFYQFFAVIIATAFISSAITLTISASGPTGFGTVLEPGGLVEGAAYTIYQDSGTIYAKNGSSGELTYQSTNASYVFQQVIDELSTGGKIAVREGHYHMAWSLLFDDNAWHPSITGEGHNTQLEATGNFPLIHVVTKNPQGYNNPFLKDLQLLGGGFASTLVSFPDYGFGQNIENVRFSTTTSYAILFNYVAYGCHNIYIRNCDFGACGGATKSIIHSQGFASHIKIEGCTFGAQASGQTELVTGHYTLATISNNIFEAGTDVVTYINISGYSPLVLGNTFANGLTAVKFYNGCFYGRVIGNMFIDNVNDYVAYVIPGGGYSAGVTIADNAFKSFTNGIVIGNMTTVTNDGWNTIIDGNTFNTAKGTYSNCIRLFTARCTISNNVVYAGGTMNAFIKGSNADGVMSGNTLGAYTTFTYVIETLAYSTKWLVDGNTIASTISTAFTDDFNDIVFGENLGYVTESKGTATITASTSITFNHGLARTPTLVLASFTPIGWGNYTWTATTTQITITVSTSGTYTVYWYAEV